MAKKRTRRSARRPRALIDRKFIISVFSIIARLLPVVLAGAVIFLVVKATVYFIINSDYFKVKAIEIRAEGGPPRLKEAEIGLDLKRGESIFRVDLKRCESSIRDKHPEFKDIKARRILPETIELSYKARRPFCQVDSGYFYLVSEDGIVLPNPLVAADPELPIITGIDVLDRALPRNRQLHSKALKRAISLLKEIAESNFSKSHKVVKINIYDPQSPSIYIEDGTRIEIGEYSFKEKERLLAGVVEDLESKNKKAKIIDLRFDDVVVIPR